MLVPGEEGEVTIEPVDEDMVVENEITEQFNELLHEQNNTLFHETSANQMTNDSSIQPSTELHAGVRTVNPNKGTVSFNLYIAYSIISFIY